MNLGDAYKAVTFGRDEPEMMITGSTKGPVMLTRDAAYLLGEDGNIVGEIDREKWVEELKSKVLLK